jgi:uncharacterized protein YecE (DUF72 family)
MPIYVACSGFPVPVSRYFTEFSAVEISDTEIGIPGAGTTRRWLREAPSEAAFTVLAGKQLAESGFVADDKNLEILKDVGEFAKTLDAKALVICGGVEFGPTRPNRANLRKFFEALPEGLPRVVVDMPGWPLATVEATIKDKQLTIAYDPLEEEPHHVGEFAYVRLMGPSGYRSRYDDEAMDKIAAYCNACKAKEVFCVFRNSDRFVNAKRAMAALKS